jgi:hypothetical protein
MTMRVHSYFGVHDDDRLELDFHVNLFNFVPLEVMRTKTYCCYSNDHLHKANESFCCEKSNL